MKEGKIKAGIEDQHYKCCITCHADFKEYLINIGIEEQVMEEVTIIEG